MFKKVISLVLASALISSVFAFPAQAITPSSPTQALVSAAWLKENIADKKLVILHVGDADNSVYVRGHIEGAQYLDWKTELANASESKLRNGVVVQSKFQQVVKRLGIDSPYEAENVLGGDRVIGTIRATFQTRVRLQV